MSEKKRAAAQAGNAEGNALRGSKAGRDVSSQSVPSGPVNPTPPQSSADVSLTASQGPNALSRSRSQQVKERARRLGISALAEAVRLWISVMNDEKKHVQYRIRCSENIADRFGLPREEVVATLEDEAPKLVEIQTFDAPPSYAADPPPPAH